MTIIRSPQVSDAGNTVLARPGVGDISDTSSGDPSGGSQAGPAAFGLGFGTLRLGAADRFEDSATQERAFFLLHGQADITIRGTTATVRRADLLAELPTVVHIPSGESVEIRTGEQSAEFVYFFTPNATRFDSRIIDPGSVSQTRLVSEALKETTERELRTVLDDKGDPESEMTAGELVNLPGRWSSYPPHTHPHPEIYHYRFVPEHGFGYSQVGDEVHVVRNGDTVFIPPGVVHPQVAAPGFAMVYVWGMPHLPGERFGASSRRFVPSLPNLEDPA